MLTLIVVGSIRVRLDGISPAERGHATYRETKQFVLQLMCSAQTVECKLEGRMSYNREVGECGLSWVTGAVLIHRQKSSKQVWRVIVRDTPVAGIGGLKHVKAGLRRCRGIVRLCLFLPQSSASFLR